MAKLDGKIDNSERAYIIEKIGDGHLFPEHFLKQVEKGGQITQIFDKAVEDLITHYPEDGRRMVEFFIELALVDKNLTRDEVDHIFRFAQSINFSDYETALILRDKIREKYVPKTL